MTSTNCKVSQCCGVIGHVEARDLSIWRVALFCLRYSRTGQSFFIGCRQTPRLICPIFDICGLYSVGRDNASIPRNVRPKRLAPINPSCLKRHSVRHATACRSIKSECLCTCAVCVMSMHDVSRIVHGKCTETWKEKVLPPRLH